MRKFDPKINVGEIIASRIRGYPYMEEEPKKRVRKGKPKKKPKKGPPCWIICPSLIVQPPKILNTREQREKNYCLTVNIYSETRKERDEALDHMIRCGQEEIEAGNKRIWLHGSMHSIQRRGFWEAELKYNFRVKKAPEEIS